MKKMKIPFYKCNANGNTFIIVVGNKKLNRDFFNKNQIKKICSTKDKELVDGFILLNIINDKFIMNYFNNDGNWETFCLNGLRCVALILNKELCKKDFTIKCNDEIYSTKVNIEDATVDVFLNEPLYYKKDISCENYIGDYINSGAKHFVIRYNDKWPKMEKLEKISKLIRYNTNIFPDGVNVNFYKVVNHDTIEVKTYEKGIESMMASCASGSYACAYDFSKKQSILGKINIINDGGVFNITFNKHYKKNKLIGKAEIEYKGVL